MFTIEIDCANQDSINVVCQPSKGSSLITLASHHATLK